MVLGGEGEDGSDRESGSQRRPPPIKSTSRIMCMEQEIKAHTRSAERNEKVCYAEVCPHCRWRGPFHPHDCRRRTFRLVKEQSIQVLRSWILRWRCRNCGKRFTDYPPLLLCPESGS